MINFLLFVAILCRERNRALRVDTLESNVGKSPIAQSEHASSRHHTCSLLFQDFKSFQVIYVWSNFIDV